MNLRLAIAALCLAASLANAQPAPDLAFEQRLKLLESQLRCLVCQNQTLADSAAGLADNLRREVRALALAGKSDAEIRDYLVSRYGDFVLYDPPVKSITWLLWFGPFALLVAGAGVWFTILRRRGKGDEGDPTPAAETSDAEARARAWLKGPE
jgi:cytochrome c-type biogenesis protein CcmH